MASPQIVWLRRDLRLADNPALYHAAKSGPVLPVFVLDDEAAARHAYGGASRWWLHHSLEGLSNRLAQRGSCLILRRGNAVEELTAIARETGAEAIHANHHYEPWWRKAQQQLSDRFDFRLYDANYLIPPGMVRAGSGQPYKIYTPFLKAALAQLSQRESLPEPGAFAEVDTWPGSETLASWKLLPTRPDWSAGLQEFWQVGEEAAHKRLTEWRVDIVRYAAERDMPSKDGTSRLSPHLHFGELSALQVWNAIRMAHAEERALFEKELIWRDYAQTIITQFPDYGTQSYRTDFETLAWRDPDADRAAAADLSAWQNGRTGYPIVDAGMRQLWKTGWMHNRVRMIVASFLVKHLLIHWRHGERWFWDTLVDADYANNAVNWQWVAGTGVDSNMFSRIMAPLSQSEKFSSSGYICEYVPELSHLAAPMIYDPEFHGCKPPDYPSKIVGHREGRARALAAYRFMKSG